MPYRLVILFFGLGIVMGAAAQDMGAEVDELSCLLEPNRVIKLSGSVPGVIARINVKRGDRIHKNQVLVRLVSRLETANVQLAQAKMEFGDRQAERNEELARKELISPNEKDQMETDNRVSALELNLAQERLRQRTIRSPITGFVQERLASPGEYLGNSPVLTLVATDPLYVEVIVPVSWLGRIKTGMQAQVEPDVIGGSYTAKVTVVDPVVDPESDTFRVRLQLPNPSNRISAGLKCEIKFKQN